MEVSETVSSELVDEQPPKRKRARSLEEKSKRNLEQHPLLQPCKCERKKCYQNHPEEERIYINQLFWNVNFNARRQWLDANISITIAGKSKQNTLRFFLPKPDEARVEVCKVMFLQTLGLKTDKRITKFAQKKSGSIEGSVMPINDLRGKHAPANVSDHNAIESHINSTILSFLIIIAKIRQIADIWILT